MKITLLLAILLMLYTYLGYPALLFCLTAFKRREVRKAAVFPRVSVLIAAHNEEGGIGRRIDDLLGQDYPGDRMEIIVVSDGSTDATDAILTGRYAGRIRYARLPRNMGKAAALNAGAAMAGGDVLLFADARQTFAPDAIRILVANFADRTVGAVSGRLVLSAGERSSIKSSISSYWNYEVLVRRMESATGSVIGATGAIYAIRRELYRELPGGTLLDDVLIPMRIVLQGLRVVYEEAALAYDRIEPSAEREFRRKVRTLTGNFQLLALEPALLSLRNPYLGRFVSHKLLRLLVPYELITILALNVMLAAEYPWLLAAQAAFYSLAVLARVMRLKGPLSISYAFVLLNWAAVKALGNFLSGKENVWDRSVA